MNDEEWGWLRRIHTEEEWCRCETPQPLLTYLGTTASNRKFRLYAVGCARRIWSHLPNASRSCVEVAEQFADGQADERERVAAEETADAVVDAVVDAATDDNEDGDVTYHATLSAAWCTRSFPTDAPETAGHAAFYAATTEGAKEPYVALLRCVFGSPFRPATIHCRWLMSNVTQLAQTIYDERAFDRLPILADALEEASCDNIDLLDHCRSKGPHVRGCWPVDLLLGKS